MNINIFFKDINKSLSIDYFNKYPDSMLTIKCNSPYFIQSNIIQINEISSINIRSNYTWVINS